MISEADRRERLAAADNAAKARDIDRALDIWSALRSDDPDDPTAYRRAVAALREAGRVEAAEAIASEAYARFTDDFVILLERARFSDRRKAYDEAIERWRELAERHSHNAMGYMGQANSLMESGRADEAAAMIRATAERFPDNISSIISYARLAEREKNWHQAVALWKRVRELWPDGTLGYTEGARGLVRLGLGQDADDLLARAAERFPNDPQPAIVAAEVADDRQAWQQSLERWKSVVQRFSGIAIGYRRLAQILIRLGMLKEADSVLSEAVRRFSDDIELILTYAEVARHRDEWAEVAARLKPAVERFPHDARVSHPHAEAVETSTWLEHAKAESRTSPRYLLYVCTRAGLGHLMVGMLQSAYYAYKTGRILVLDMREFPYFKDDRHNEFFRHFGVELPNDLKLITDIEEVDRISLLEDVVHVSSQVTLDFRKRNDHAVLVVPSYTPGAGFDVNKKRSDSPFRLVLLGPLLEAWTRMNDAGKWSGPVIGMHFRAMVGETDGRMNRLTVPDYDERYKRIKDRYIAIAKSIAAEQGYADPAYFVASDDAEFVEYIKASLPNSFSKATHLPKNENWREHVESSGYDLSVLIDAVNDVWYLSACDYLICSRHSGFTKLAALNSDKLSTERIRQVETPYFKDILKSLDPIVAADWARAAVRKYEALGVRDAYYIEALVEALDRIDATEEAAAARQQAKWYFEAGELPRPAVDTAAEFKDLAIAKRRVALAPQNPYVLAEFCVQLEVQGFFFEAIALTRQVMEKLPGDPRILRRLGTLLLRTDVLDEAEAVLREAIGIDPSIALCHLELAHCLGRQGRLEEALAEFCAASAAEPDNASILAELGQGAARSKKFQQAEEALEKALSIRFDPRDEALLRTVRQQRGALANEVAA